MPVKSAPLESNSSCACDLDNMKLRKNVNKSANFAGRCGYFDRNSFNVKIEYISAKRLKDIEQLNSTALFEFHLDQAQFSFYETNLMIQVLNLNDIAQAVELLGNLIDHPFIAGSHDCHTAYGWIICCPNGQTVDIVSPGRKEAGYVRQHAKSILNKN